MVPVQWPETPVCTMPRDATARPIRPSRSQELQRRYAKTEGVHETAVL